MAALLAAAALTAALLAGTERESDATPDVALQDCSPTFYSVVPGDGSIWVEWGQCDSGITKRAYAEPGGHSCSHSRDHGGIAVVSRVCTITGLTNGVTYTVTADGVAGSRTATPTAPPPTTAPPTTVPPPTTAPPGPVSVQGPAAPTTTLPPVVFEDVAPDAPYHGHVQDIARRGVTAGCGTEPLRFCPDGLVTRAQMAVFLSRALDLPAPPSGLRSFADVGSGHFAAGAVEAVRIAGITAGCATGPLRFCPADQTSLAQMATFLRRAFAFASAVPQRFEDTRGSVHEADIDALYRAGIMDACGTEPLRFCPDEAVTRAQMATFLSRALRCVERGPQLQEGAQPVRTCPRPGRNP